MNADEKLKKKPMPNQEDRSKTKKEKKQAKPKRTRPPKHVVGTKESIETVDILKNLAEIRFNGNGKIVVGGTKEHADILKKHCITGLNKVLRSIQKDEISFVIILLYKHLGNETTTSIDMISGVLKTCEVIKSFKTFYNITSQSNVRSIFQIEYNPRVVAIKKSYLDVSEMQFLKNN